MTACSQQQRMVNTVGLTFDDYRLDFCRIAPPAPGSNVVVGDRQHA